MFRQFPSFKPIVKTIFVFLLPLITGLALANSIWAHGGGGVGVGGRSREGGVGVVGGAVEAQGAAVVVLAEAGTEEEWDTAVATQREWGTVVATVRVTAALDLAAPALGIRGTT